MKTIQEIRDEVAKERGYDNWELLNGSDLYDCDIDKVAIKYSQECNKELVEILEVVKSKLTFNEQGLYNKIQDLLNKVKQTK